MSLKFGRHLMSIPGPTVVPDRVLNAMHKPAPNIYEGEMIDITASILPDLKTVAKTSGNVAIYISNGHGAWEAVISNTLSKGDKVLVLGTGRFAILWGEFGKHMGIEPHVLDFGSSYAADPDVLEEILKADKNHEYKAIFLTQTDTGSSASNNIPALRQALEHSGHPALFMVDCIASLGCEPHLMDEWGVDVMVAGCQKGLMTPPGLSFVFSNERAHKARETAGLVTNYWDWKPRHDPKIYSHNFSGTAPTHHIYGLRTALDMLVHEEGVENAWARHEILAKAIWAAVETWTADGGDLVLNVKNRTERSHAVTAITTTNGNGTKIRTWCEDMAGVTLGIGLGMAPTHSKQADNYFRIGHMGHINVPMVMGTLSAIDAAMKALGIPHGSGALEAATREISKA